MGLFPRNETFFELLNQFVSEIHKGAEVFVKLFDDFAQNAVYAKQIKEIERECDRHSDSIVALLNSSFITPLDREDIYQLATELDDIMDMINEMARLTVLYNVTAVTPAAGQLARILEESTRELQLAFAGLRARKGVQEHIDRVRALEEQGDDVVQEATRKLFTEEQNPMEVIKWLKIYEEMDASLDRAKQVTNVLAGIMFKHA